MDNSKRNLKGLLEQNGLIVDFLPDPYVPVVVHCERYSCMGYLDEKGIWRGRFNDHPLSSRVIAWEPL